MRKPYLQQLKTTFPVFAGAAIALSAAFGQTSAPPTGASTDLATTINAMVAEPAVARTHWGVMVTTMDGQRILAVNEGQLFQPASNAKLFTTAAALALLGPERQFETRVEARGRIDAAGVVHGDLVLVGGGDANFGSQNIPYGLLVDKSQKARATDLTIADIEELADKTVAKGVKRIVGDVTGDDTLFAWEPYPSDWSWNDLVWGYGAPVSALMIHDNAVDISISAKEEMKTTIGFSPTIPYYKTTSWVLPVTGERDCSHIDFSRPVGSTKILVQGEVAIGKSPCVEHLAIQDPAEYAASALKIALERRGVKVAGKSRAIHATAIYDPQEPIESAEMAMAQFIASGKTDADKCTVITLHGPEPVELAAHLSPTLRQDVIFTNKVSQNQHAELLLRNIGVRFTCTSSQAVSLDLVRQWILGIGIDKDDFVFFDGSGMSGHDLVTPRAIVTLLQFAATQPWFATYKASLPIGGVDGSLESRFTKAPLKGHVFAKTGTNSETRALSGYLECASGRTVIFSILAGDHFPSTTADREVIDRIVAAIAAAN